MRRPPRPSTRALLAGLAAAAALALPARHAAAQGAATGAAASAAERVTRIADAYLAALDSIGRESRARNEWPRRAAADLAPRHRLEDAYLARLGGIADEDVAGTPAWLTLGVLREELESSRALRVCRSELWDVNHLTGWHLGLPPAAASAPVGSAAERDAALARFAALGDYVEREIALLREGLGAGYVVPAPTVRRVIAQVDVMVPADPAASPLWAPARRAAAPEFAARWQGMLERSAYPALRRYRDYLETEYLPRARATLGLGALPDGDACYRAQLRAMTSLDLDPDELRRSGAEARRRVDERLRPLLAEIAPGAEPHVARNLVRYAEGGGYPSREAMLTDVRAHLARAEAALPRVLLEVPAVRLEVEPTPAYREQSDPGARYNPPADSTSPGRVLVNTYGHERRPRVDGANLAFHEGWPGHHLQIVYPRRAAVVHPVLRRFATGAFTEGWAFYAEQLADELGLYATPRERAAYLLHQVDGWLGLQVDPAVHVEGWSREMAADTIQWGSGKPRDVAELYADRHAATPAQLVSYMAGYRHLVALRDSAQRALGDRFDLREFHDVVLRDGSIPLRMVSANVARWVGERRAAAAPSASRR